MCHPGRMSNSLPGVTTLLQKSTVASYTLQHPITQNRRKEYPTVNKPPFFSFLKYQLYPLNLNRKKNFILSTISPPLSLSRVHLTPHTLSYPNSPHAPNRTVAYHKSLNHCFQSTALTPPRHTTVLPKLTA